VKNTLTAFGGQTRFVEKMTWSKHLHLEPFLQRAVDFKHIRAVGDIQPQISHAPVPGAWNAATLDQVLMLWFAARPPKTQKQAKQAKPAGVREDSKAAKVLNI
jgi:hypothetical protein